MKSVTKNESNSLYCSILRVHHFIHYYKYIIIISIKLCKFLHKYILSTHSFYFLALKIVLSLSFCDSRLSIWVSTIWPHRQNRLIHMIQAQTTTTILNIHMEISIAFGKDVKIPFENPITLELNSIGNKMLSNALCSIMTLL